MKPIYKAPARVAKLRKFLKTLGRTDYSIRYTPMCLHEGWDGILTPGKSMLSIVFPEDLIEAICSQGYVVKYANAGCYYFKKENKS